MTKFLGFFLVFSVIFLTILSTRLALHDSLPAAAELALIGTFLICLLAGGLILGVWLLTR